MSPVFIHVPRTGGNSLLPHLVDKNTHVVPHVVKEGLCRWRGSWVFSFARDPVDRVKSAYAYLLRGGLSDQDNKDADQYVRPFADFEDFVLNGLAKAAAEQRHFLPQHYWLTDEEGNIAANFLGRTERLQEDFNHVCAICGWPVVSLGKLNSSLREGLVSTPAMDEVIRRVYDADYRLLQKLEVDRTEMMMGRILTLFQKNYSLETRDVVWNACMNLATKVELNEANLENMCGTNLVVGFGGGRGREEIVRLAEALGVSGIRNPENDAYHNAQMHSPVNVVNLTPDEILDKIQTAFPFQIKFPPFSGNCVQGTPTKFGVTSNRHIYYLWVAKRVLELCPDRTTGIIEIGAGFGMLGYYLNQLGYRDYTAIDLALVNACQTYFLHRNLPARNLILSGDVVDPFSLDHKDSIKLLHATDFKSVPTNRFGIMVNMDGLTEYGLEQATRYVQSDCAPILFSINHEVNPFRVRDIPQPHRKMAYRYPFWLRPGYVEELYVPK